MERIWVSDGTGVNRQPGNVGQRSRTRAEIDAYLYSGWAYAGWGSAPYGSTFAGLTGFYFTRENDSSGSGFGADQLLARLASGLHFGTRCDLP